MYITSVLYITLQSISYHYFIHNTQTESQFFLGIFLKILWLYMYYRSKGRVGYGSKGAIGHIENIFRVSKLRVDHKMCILKYQYSRTILKASNSHDYCTQKY